MSGQNHDAFESINLASTAFTHRPHLPNQLPESSDDGLDPEDFLTTNNYHNVSTDKDGTISPVNISMHNISGTATPLLGGSLAGMHLPNGSMSESLVGSVDPESFDLDVQAIHDSKVPLDFLVSAQHTLKTNLRNHISSHKEFLHNGDDCSEIRLLLANDLQKLSDNFFQLNELYSTRLSSTQHVLANFRSWDNRRSKVLRKIRSIKSQNNSYGTKLAALLDKRTEIDLEVQALEIRLSELKANRLLVDKEIDEASSVLESKSAKYVNIFRDLERQGYTAISSFLHQDGMPELDLSILLQKKPVEAGFTYTEKPRPHEPAQASKSPEPSNPTPIHDTMGIQPIELPPPDVTGVESSRNETPDSPYSRGYEKGLRQLESVKKGVAYIVKAVYADNQRNSHHSPSVDVDDTSNTIVEKIDFAPIAEVLGLKIEALQDLSVKASKSSISLHEQADHWSSISLALGSKESQLLSLLSLGPLLPKDIENLLVACLNTVLAAVEVSKSRKHDAKYLNIILHHEKQALLNALSQISTTNTYKDELSSLDSSLLDTVSYEAYTPPSNLHMKMTSAGYKPPAAATTTIAPETANPTILTKLRKSPYQPVAKDFKKE